MSSIGLLGDKYPSTTILGWNLSSPILTTPSPQEQSKIKNKKEINIFIVFIVSSFKILY